MGLRKLAFVAKNQFISIYLYFDIHFLKGLYDCVVIMFESLI